MYLGRGCHSGAGESGIWWGTRESGTTLAFACAASNKNKRHFLVARSYPFRGRGNHLAASNLLRGRSFSSETGNAITEQRESANYANRFVSGVRIAMPAPSVPHAG